jgi:Poly(R)-hydroxyalkanoic acid synthase subunit (PHA_synth_III_E)
MIWDVWKKGFVAWEQATSQLAEKVFQNPGVLAPTGAMFTAAMKTKAAADRALDLWWSAWGLPTRRDQERLLHKLNQLESRLMDLDEQLEGE